MKEQIERFIHLISMEYDSGITIAYDKHYVASTTITIYVILEIDNDEYKISDSVILDNERIDFNSYYDYLTRKIKEKVVERRKA